MEFSSNTVFAKTGKGNEEITSRKWGLTPRLRQILILIDGRRSYGELCRMMGDKEMAAYALALNSDGFIVGQNLATTPVSTTPARDLSPSHSNAGGALLNADTEDSELAIATEAAIRPANAYAASTSALPVSTPAAAAPDFATARRALLRTLSDSLGPFAQDISLRIEKTKSLSEMRELLPAVCAVVEAVRGKGSVGDFLSKVGRL